MIQTTIAADATAAAAAAAATAADSLAAGLQVSSATTAPVVIIFKQDLSLI